MIKREDGFTAVEIILAIVAVAGIGAAVYFAYTGRAAKDSVATTKPTPVVAVSASPKPTSTGTPDNRPTFTSTDGHHSYRYPAGWKKLLLGVQSPDFNEVISQGSGMSNITSGASFTVDSGNTGLDASTSIDRHCSENLTTITGHPTVSNLKGVQCDFNGHEGLYGTFAYFKKGNVLYAVYLKYAKAGKATFAPLMTDFISTLEIK